MSKSFIKKVLIEEGELDRLQQRQLRDYSAELQSMAHLQTKMAEILARTDLSAQKKLNLLSGQQNRFDKIKKDIGVLSGGPAPAAANKPNLPKDQAEEVEEEDEEDEEKEAEEAAADARPEFTFTPTTTLVCQMGVASIYEKKARNLMTKIQDHPEILRRTRYEEIDINGETISGTNFNELFKNMVGPKLKLNLPGIAQFLGALRQMGVKSTELSRIKLQELYRRAPPKGAPRSRLATLRGQQQGIEKVED
jgi:hypothetical protein